MAYRGCFREGVMGAALNRTLCVSDERNVLLRARPVTCGSEHLISRKHQLDGSMNLTGCDGSQNDMHPQEALGAKSAAYQRRQDANLLFSDAEIPCKSSPFPGDPSCTVIDRQGVALPRSNRR